MRHKSRHAKPGKLRPGRLAAVAGAASLLTGVGLAIAGPVPAQASTSGCLALGPSCGANVNAFGNAWDAAGQKAVPNNKVISWPNGSADPATDWIRTGSDTSGFRYELAKNGVKSGLCVSDPDGGYAADPGGKDGLVERACNSSSFQLFKPGKTNTFGAQLVNVASGLPVQTNGTGHQLTGGGSYAGGLFWQWRGGALKSPPPPAVTFSLYANADSVAACKSGNPVLSPGTSAGTSAQVDVNSPPADVPSSAPSFTADKYSAGDPRWVIEFHNGMYIFGTPATAATSSDPTTWTWAVNPGGPQSTDYATAVADAKAGGLDNWVTAAFVVDDQGGTGLGPVTLTGVQYDGVTFTCS